MLTDSLVKMKLAISLSFRVVREDHAGFLEKHPSPIRQSSVGL